MNIKSFLDAVDPNGKMKQELNRCKDMLDDPTECMLCLKEDNERRRNNVTVVSILEQRMVQHMRIFLFRKCKSAKAFTKVPSLVALNKATIIKKVVVIKVLTLKKLMPCGITI